MSAVGDSEGRSSGCDSRMDDGGVAVDLVELLHMKQMSRVA